MKGLVPSEFNEAGASQRLSSKPPTLTVGHLLLVLWLPIKGIAIPTTCHRVDPRVGGGIPEIGSASG